ncbi:hypothetical protein PINS_up004806 [Pythium insidiosum]|nr:hypothetical protein PINS_up004806 [Pythium insidiosum]
MLVGRGRRALLAAAARETSRWNVPARAVAQRLSAAVAPPCHRWLSSSPDADGESSSSDGAAAVTRPPKNEKDALFLRALRLFYEKEGHFFVPTDFVVPRPLETNATTTPASESWPPELWDLPLGLRLRNFARGISNDYKRDMLKSIGFPYDSWKTYIWEEQLVPSLRVHRDIEGHTFVRFPFVVAHGDERYPRQTWGFKLGFSVAVLRQHRHTLTEEQVQVLDDVGFLWSEGHYKLKVLLIPTLQRFRELFGHSDVPRKYVVPSRPEDLAVWDESHRDVKLGYLMTSLKNGVIDSDTITDCEALLQDAGVFDEGSADSAWRDVTLPALLAFPTIKGSHEIPIEFVVPEGDDQWPRASWGHRLGYVVHAVLNDGVFSEQLAGSKAELRGIGYRWDVLFGKWSRQLLPAMRLYRELHGNCDIPASFVTPHDDERWPKELRDYALGRHLQLLRKAGRASPDVEDALDELDSLGFKFDVASSEFEERILPALETYAAKLHHCDVPRSFVVPHQSDWDQRLWGLRLGYITHSIRTRKQYRKQVEKHSERLREIGFAWQLSPAHAAGSNTSPDRKLVRSCLAVFMELHGHDDVPSGFVVPVNDSDDVWPAGSAGLELGKWAHLKPMRRLSRHAHHVDADPANIRGSGTGSGSTPASAGNGSSAGEAMNDSQDQEIVLQPHQEQYWNDVLMASFRAFASRHGSCADMDDNYVVPSEAPFPQMAWGVNLGLRVRYIRHHDRYAAEKAKYRDELERLGVIRASSEEA